MPQNTTRPRPNGTPAGTGTPPIGATHQTQDNPLAVYCESAARFVAERPMTSVMALFGVGLGVGIAVGSLISKPSQVASSTSAERIGRSILDSLANAIPESLGGRS